MDIKPIYSQDAFIVRKPTLLRELPTGETPASRLEHYGAGALSTQELLIIVTGFDNLEDGADLLATHDGLAGLARIPWAELVAIKGIGPGRAARIKAAFEIGRRNLVACPAEKPIVKSPADAANFLMAHMNTLEQEHILILNLDTRNHVLSVTTLYIGSLNTALIRIAEVFRDAIRLNASGIIMAHNHPSGDPSPSPEDIHVTRQIVEAGKLLNIDVLDHVIIGQNRWVSLKERGMGF